MTLRAMALAVDIPPRVGDIVRVRARRYLVEEVTPPPEPGEDTLVRLSCLEDDAEGEELQVLWERELDSARLDEADWSKLTRGEFDPTKFFAAYYRTLRWNTVTSTDPNLFQAPYRAGIRLDAYQLEPLRKALLLPRVNLFIADDVGLGKTIEAGLVVRELLLRQRTRRIVVAAPPSVVLQWKEEFDQRFGLTFVVLDREYVRRMKVERGYATNPWATHSRFVVSHNLLRDEEYAATLRDWLEGDHGDALLILDEAHNAAPASGARYAVDSQFTKSIRELAPLFQHRLFLSATPHNGHSNSFSALLEILDPQRFCRGVPVESAKQLEPVMVRRLKDDLRKLEGGFPIREIVEVPIVGLPADDPELVLPQLLDEYRLAREERLKNAAKAVQAASALVLCSLQKRLLSSIEAFACTLKVHRDAFEAHAKKVAEGKASCDGAEVRANLAQLKLLASAPDGDDDRSEAKEEDVSAEEASAIAAATAKGDVSATADQFERERQLLARMTDLANATRSLPDARVRHLIAWSRAHRERRALIFTEYADTKRYLEKQLRAALTPGREADPLIATFHGGMTDEAREEVKRAFNAELSQHPLRVLIATDAAREGVNLQNNCADLFHVDVPWNPSRLEQRNGRIDRKLQRSSTVRCHYFVYEQRPEDRVLKALVQKTKTIRRELGSLAPVVERRLEDRLSAGFARKDAQRLAVAIETENLDPEREKAVQVELEAGRKREVQLKEQIVDLQNLLKKSSDWLHINKDDLRQAISCGLELLGGKPLQREAGTDEYVLPAVVGRLDHDQSWLTTLDTLRPPRKRDQPLWEWRRDASIRPVVFADPGSLDARTVQLHLEHRFVQRLLGRFKSQGFVYHDLARACVGVTDDPVPRVILLGRLSLYGPRASRLHDEILAVAARWVDIDVRKESLKTYGDTTLEKTLDLLDRMLRDDMQKELPAEVRARLGRGADRDLDELKPLLEVQANERRGRAIDQLRSRADQEAAAMRAILETQRARIEQTAAAREREQPRLDFENERRQLAADKRYWQRRLASLERELDAEPTRIRQSYDVKAARFEPVGLVYLWPVTG
jgi:SNF2 family DNA or RNA helicase